jgi:hypothetical protein
MIENFQHKKTGASSHSTAAMLNRINHHQSGSIAVPGSGGGGGPGSMVVTSVAGSPGTTLIIGNNNNLPAQQQVVSSTSSSTSSSLVKRSSQVGDATLISPAILIFSSDFSMGPSIFRPQLFPRNNCHPARDG